MSILDYAQKQWSGLIVPYYKRRWQLFVGYLIASATTRQPVRYDDYLNLVGSSRKQQMPNEKAPQVYKTVELPFTYIKSNLSETVKGDSIAIAKKLRDKYIMTCYTL